MAEKKVKETDGSDMTVREALEKGYALVPAGELGKSQALAELSSGGLGVILDVLDDFGKVMKTDSYEDKFKYGAEGLVKFWGIGLSLAKAWDDRKKAEEQEMVNVTQESELRELRDLLESTMDENKELREALRSKVNGDIVDAEYDDSE